MHKIQQNPTNAMRIKRLMALPVLFRFLLSFVISLTALAGFYQNSRVITPAAAITFLAVFLLAAGASALNQIQELRSDALMSRTAARPLPLKLYPNSMILLVSLVAVAAGIFLLAAFTTPPAALAGLGALLWYNGVYTPLKKKTGYAFLPGAVCGALPPIIGILASGRSASFSEIGAIGLFMYVWQIPHVILIFQRHTKAYASAQQPIPAFLFNERKTRNIIFTSFLACALIAQSFPLCGVISGHFVVPVLSIINISAVLFVYLAVLAQRGEILFRQIQAGLSIYQVMILSTFLVPAL